MEKVDTLSLQYYFMNDRNKEKIANNIKSRLHYNYNEDKQLVYYTGKCKLYGFYYNTRTYCLTITLQHKQIKDKTYLQIQEEAEKFIRNYFNINTNLEGLNRIDYKNDILINEETELNIIKNIFEKATDSILKNYNKEINESEGFYKVRYRSKGSSSAEIVFYDKGKEMLKLLKENRVQEDEANRYKHLFRTEVRIKNKRLNYEKRSYGQDKVLLNYYNEEQARNFYNYYIKKILGTERFYRIDIAKKIINESKKLKNKMKEKLTELLLNVNKKGYTEAMENYNKGTFRTYKKKIEALGINILTFNEKVNGNETVEYIENFGLMK